MGASPVTHPLVHLYVATAQDLIRQNNSNNHEQWRGEVRWPTKTCLCRKSFVIVQQYTVWIEVTVSGSFYWVIRKAIPQVTAAALNGSIEHLPLWGIVDGAQLLHFVTQRGTEEEPTEMTSYFWSEENKENGVGKPLTWISNTLHRERKTLPLGDSFSQVLLSDISVDWSKNAKVCIECIRH